MWIIDNRYLKCYFFSAIIAIILVENVLGAKNRGQYIELDNTTTEAYLCIEEENCNVVYICKKLEETFFHDKLYDCYNRNEHTDMNFFLIVTRYIYIFFLKKKKKF